MAYTINKTNGSVITTLSDGTVDQQSTSITLIGKKYAGYGEFLNENFVKLLENFSSNTAPTAPLAGQLWWDTTTGVLNAYTGTIWKHIPNSSMGSSLPAQSTFGDLWWDTTSNQLKVCDQGGVFRPAGGSLTLSGDITGTGSGAVTTALSATGVTAGNYGTASSTPTLAIDAKGRITSASNTAINITSSQVSNFAATTRTSVSANSGLTYNSTTGVFGVDSSVIPSTASGGAALVGYTAGGTGAVTTTVQAKLRESVSVFDFMTAAQIADVKAGNATLDVTAALNAFLTACRTEKKPGFIPAGTYLTSATLDISGVDIEGVLGGLNNSDGTIIKGSGDHVILNQGSVSAGNVTYSIKNLRVRDGSVGLRMSYAVHCRIENLFITNCTDGIYCGVNDVLGPLWNNFKNCRVDVTGVALSIHGTSFANANIFDTCFFKGGSAGGSVTCTGGIGAVANHFINTEFVGPGRGVNLLNTKSTLFDNCYFESEGPSVVVDGFTLDAALDRCTFGSVKNNNADSVPSFIWHKSGACRVSVNGGYVYITAGTEYNNLRFVQSDVPASFGIAMTDLPDQEISASGWQVFANGLPTSNDRVFFSANYTPTWTTGGTAPSLGNGTIAGRYTLSGRICTAQIEFVAGSTTTFGTGPFQFSLPFASSSLARQVNGVGRISDAGVGFHIGLVEVNPGSSNAVIYSNNAANLVQNNSPFTWAASDALRFTITYEVAI